MDNWDETCKKHQAWARAQTDFLDNGMGDDVKWKRCVRSGSMSRMDQMCWENLLRAYGN